MEGLWAVHEWYERQSRMRSRTRYRWKAGQLATPKTRSRWGGAQRDRCVTKNTVHVVEFRTLLRPDSLNAGEFDTITILAPMYFELASTRTDRDLSINALSRGISTSKSSCLWVLSTYFTQNKDIAGGTCKFRKPSRCLIFRLKAGSDRQRKSGSNSCHQRNAWAVCVCAVVVGGSICWLCGPSVVWITRK